MERPDGPHVEPRSSPREISIWGRGGTNGIDICLGSLVAAFHGLRN